MNVIVVRMKIKKSSVDAFESEMKRHIAWTRAHEPGCLVFQVGSDAREPGAYHVYEVFRDPEAREKHSRSPSLAVLNERLSAWLEDRVQYDATSLEPTEQ